MVSKRECYENKLSPLKCRLVKIITIVVKIKMAAFPSIAAANCAAVAVAAREKSFSVCVDRFARRDTIEARAYCCGVLSGVTNQIRPPQKTSRGVDGNIAGLNNQ